MMRRDFWECWGQKFDNSLRRDFSHREKPAIGGPFQRSKKEILQIAHWLADLAGFEPPNSLFGNGL